jgi:diguanylate cyclase (GGDEF)-like protein
LAVTALHIMRGHGLKAMGVADGGEWVGVVTRERLEGAHDSTPVGHIMDAPSLALPATTPIRRAAEMFVEADVLYAAVLEEGRFSGMISCLQLLKELGQSWDPLTNLSWTDRLREWGIDQLSSGNEITLIFLDIDDFGSYNKRFGHMIGDRVLTLFARALSAMIDPTTDMLVRFGGDEFLIGTLRTREQAESFVHRFRDFALAELSDEVQTLVDFSVGFSGGKRTKEREKVHFASTINNLINIASQDCMSTKSKKKPTSPANSEERTPTMLPTVHLVTADETAQDSPTTVWLSVGGQLLQGLHLRGDKPLIESVAIATGRALERIHHGREVIVDNIHLVQGPHNERMVAFTGRLKSESAETPIAAHEIVNGNLYQATAKAVVEAVESTLSES